jgi:hypothetical protein
MSPMTIPEQLNEREEKLRGGEEQRGTLPLTGGGTDKFTAMKGPRRCPLVLLVKVEKCGKVRS